MENKRKLNTIIWYIMGTGEFFLSFFKNFFKFFELFLSEFQN